MYDIFPQVEEFIDENAHIEGLNGSKWHIWNIEKETEDRISGYIMQWNENAIEFDSEAAAQRFLNSILDIYGPEEMDIDDIKVAQTEVDEDNFSYINLSNYILVRNGDTDELKEVGPIGS